MDWPAWIQAVGSVGAILVTAGVVIADHRIGRTAQRRAIVDGLAAEIRANIGAHKLARDALGQAMAVGQDFWEGIPIFPGRYYDVFRGCAGQLGLIGDAKTVGDIVRFYHGLLPRTDLVDLEKALASSKPEDIRPRDTEALHRSWTGTVELGEAILRSLVQD